MNITLSLRILLLSNLALKTIDLAAQSPTVTCPPASLMVNDTSNNDSQYWNAVYWWAPDIASNNLGESSMVLDILATDHCSVSGNLSFRYILSLDLDNDHIAETFIDSDNLPTRNTVYVGNNTSILSAGTARAFDTRPVDPNQKWGFDLSVVAVGDSLKGQLIWKNDLGQTTAPELPYGTHHLQWIVTDSCGNSTVCE